MKFHKLFFAVVAVVSSVSAFAADDVVIGGIGYERIGAGSCQAYATSQLKDEVVSVHRSVVFTDENGNKERCAVHRIRLAGFKGLENMKVFKVEEATGEEPTRLVIFGEAFQNCPNLSTVELPSDVERVVVNAFNGCPKLTEIVCRAEKVPMAFYSNGDEPDFDAHEQVALYVPDASVSAYALVDNSEDKYGFWSSFNVKRLSDYGGSGGDDPEPPVPAEGVELRLPLGSVTWLDVKEGDRVSLSPDFESALVAVYFNDVDMIDRVENGIFYIPAFSGKAVIRPVFEILNSAYDVAEASVPRLRFVGETVFVDGIGVEENISITGMDGRQVYHGANGGVRLSPGAYILITANRSFKFAI